MVTTIFQVLIRYVVFFGLLVPGFVYGQDMGGSQKKVRTTFLDSVNQGKEYFLSDSTFSQTASGKARTDFSSQDSRSSTPTPAVFRIQIIASTSLEVVKYKQKEFDRDFNVKSFIAFSQPYYKLFAGEFPDKSNADRMLPKIKDRGYSDAWVVKTDLKPYQ
ncbi:MAG: SPOR domain-containing protein [Chitinivibrionales bacterium]|nr:SPOR domain-containing protein [Chitinivibrionales bacterium]